MVKFKDNDKYNFNILAPMASADGYGYSAEELVRAASKLNTNIGYVAHDWQDRRYTGQDVQELEVHRYDDKEMLVVYFIPHALWTFQADVTIAQTMFETDEIPDFWAHLINNHAKGLIVPSDFCRHVFSQKVDVPVKVAPLGVNIETYHYVEREQSNVFTFLMAGLLHYRKGAEFAVRAFKQEFRAGEPVRLILKTRKGFLDVGSETVEDDDRILVVDEDYDRKDMLDLYHAGDCFIACSRGEASGLTPREAMATGLTAIVLDWGGLSEIADPRFTYPVSVADLELAPPVCSSYDHAITQGQSIGHFARPSMDSLRAQMRHVFENQDEARIKGAHGALWMQNHWNYDECAKKWLKALEKIYNA